MSQSRRAGLARLIEVVKSASTNFAIPFFTAGRESKLGLSSAENYIEFHHAAFSDHRSAKVFFGLPGTIMGAPVTGSSMTVQSMPNTW
ncbi:hypothetical protein BAURA63_02224 [Brevibacterium aurantiacum]|uniref:Uncharacterized protein n=1 Tax=Brevibacterium aurantiacum TaxID=273384 RepID=A0A2H1JFP9_BREAU|nr:hypothetical protein BAURA63_02224 [Brevibacterium aurantiacum]